MLDHILSILIFFPALAGVLGFVVNKNSIRSYGVAVATIEFVLALWLWFVFDANASGMQFMEQIATCTYFWYQLYRGCGWYLALYHHLGGVFYYDWYSIFG